MPMTLTAQIEAEIAKKRLRYIELFKVDLGTFSGVPYVFYWSDKKVPSTVTFDGQNYEARIKRNSLEKLPRGKTNAKVSMQHRQPRRVREGPVRKRRDTGERQGQCRSDFPRPRSSGPGRGHAGKPRTGTPGSRPSAATRGTGSPSNCNTAGSIWRAASDACGSRTAGKPSRTASAVPTTR